MGKKICLWWLVIALFAGSCFAAKRGAQSDVAGVASEERLAGQDKNKRYFLIGGGAQAQAPGEGYGLVVVLPGGDGGADFNDFVRRIYKKSLSEEYLAAELVAVKWTEQQQVVWPTEKAAVEKQGFSTEEFIEAVIKDVKSKYNLNRNHIFTLSWSSGGPAAYAYSLRKAKSATGSFIAMSVFKPENLAPLEQAKGHAYFIFHSPTDETCPVSMAEAAAEALQKNGATVKLQKYGGGHSWPSYPYGRITSGIRWLEENHGEPGAEAGEPNRITEDGGEVPGEPGEPEKAVSELPPIVKAPQEANPLFRISNKKGKVGYINREGEVVIRPEFDGFFSEGFSEDLVLIVKGRKGGYIDKSGRIQFLLDKKYESASEFSEGMAVVACVVKQQLRYGYINRYGEPVIEPKFTQAKDFSEGLACVQVGGKAGGLIGGKYGYIDKTGEYVVEPKLDHGEDFSEGLACVSTGGRRGGVLADFGGTVGSKFGYIDKEGRFFIEPQFRWAKPFSNGLAAVTKGRKVGFIDRTGQFVIGPQFDSAQDFSEGLASVRVGEQGGYIDRSGNYVIGPKFKGMANSFSEGLAAVYDEAKKKFGFIDRSGEFVIEPKFGLATGFRNGLARVTLVSSLGIKNGYIDKTGKFVWGPQ
ncbi:MAG: WG repeat-containing protein [Planctomycetota bacterium]